MCCGPCGRHRVATADQLQSCKNSLRSVILNGSSFPFLKMALKQPGFFHSWMCEMWNVLYSLGNPGEKVLYCLLTDSCLSSFTMFAPLIVRTGQCRRKSATKSWPSMLSTNLVVLPGEPRLPLTTMHSSMEVRVKPQFPCIGSRSTINLLNIECWPVVSLVNLSAFLSISVEHRIHTIFFRSSSLTHLPVHNTLQGLKQHVICVLCLVPPTLEALCGHLFHHI